MLLGALSMHTVAARAYYNINSKNLQLVASTAVRAGIQYLPVDPQTAIRIADRFVQGFGVTSDEIISIDVSDDDSTLTIRLSREIPEYVSLLAYEPPSAATLPDPARCPHSPAELATRPPERIRPDQRGFERITR